MRNILRGSIPVGIFLVAFCMSKKEPTTFINLLSEPAWKTYQNELVIKSDSKFLELNHIKHSIATILSKRTDEKTAMEIATAIVAQSDRTGLNPWFIMGMIGVENPDLLFRIENSYGAVGLMQVVERFHWGSYPQCGTDDLREISTNICYGVEIYLMYHGMSSTIESALWKYNGCTQWRRDAGQHCINYPKWVTRNANRFREMATNRVVVADDE